MKRMTLGLVVLTAAALLSGCIVVPAHRYHRDDGYYRDGGYQREGGRYGDGGYYRGSVDVYGQSGRR
jgi:hypothetical protein